MKDVFLICASAPLNLLTFDFSQLFLCKKQFYLYLCTRKQMVVVAQLVRASVCGAEGRRFEPGHPP